MLHNMLCGNDMKPKPTHVFFFEHIFILSTQIHDRVSHVHPPERGEHCRFIFTATRRLLIVFLSCSCALHERCLNFKIVILEASPVYQKFRSVLPGEVITTAGAAFELPEILWASSFFLAFAWRFFLSFSMPCSALPLGVLYWCSRRRDRPVTSTQYHWPYCNSVTPLACVEFFINLSCWRI